MKGQNILLIRAADMAVILERSRLEIKSNSKTDADDNALPDESLVCATMRAAVRRVCGLG